MNICHLNSGKNSWEGVEISESAWSMHQAHGDFLYYGPLDKNGKPENKDKAADKWCEDNVPNGEPSVTPTPTESPQCKKLDQKCDINASKKECCEGLVCVPESSKKNNGKCKEPNVTPIPTVTPEVTPTPTSPVGEPTATPVPSEPTSTPGPVSTRWSALGYNATCDNSDIEVTFDTKREDGTFEEKVKVTFEYQGTKKTAETNNNGRATVMYGKNGDGAVTAVADGYPSQSTHMIMPKDCPAVGGQVLGTTTGQVLGATSYAATGNDAQSIFTATQLLGMLLIATGTARYVKASLKA